MFESRLRREISRRFNGEELRILCAEFGIDYDDDLIGQTKNARILSLIQHVQKRGQMDGLLVALERERPKFDWYSFLNGTNDTNPILSLPDKLTKITPKNRAFQIGIIVIVIVLIGGFLSLLNTYRGGTSDIMPVTPSSNLADISPDIIDPTMVNTPLSSTNIMSTPIITPTEIITKKPDVIIVEFEGASEQNIRLARRIENDLREILLSNDLDGISVSVQSESFNTLDEAKTFVANSGSKVVVWGWIDSIGVNVRIFLNDEEQVRRYTQTRELPFANPQDTISELALFARETIPDNVSFISLFVVGQLFFQSNQYGSGYEAFNAATSILPENVIFTNEALKYFFEARQLDIEGSEELNTIACNYALAIKADPTFVQAYVNLSILLYNNKTVRDAECLPRDDFGPLDYSTLMYQALNIQPNAAWLRYNVMVMEWDGSVSEQKILSAKQIIEDDPSIHGAYIMLGILSRLAQDWPAAISSFDTALTLQPDSPHILFNLGQLYTITGEYEKADSVLKQALELMNPLDPVDEILLALSNLALQKSSMEDANGYLDEISSRNDLSFLKIEPAQFNTSANIASLLGSRIAYDAGDLQEAISIVENLLDADASPHKDIFTSYLLRMLYIQNEDFTLAEDVFQASIDELCCDFSNSPNDNDTTGLAWQALDVQCSIFEATDLSKYDVRDLSNCSKGNLVSGSTMSTEEHINHIYNTLQRFISYRRLEEDRIIQIELIPGIDFLPGAP